jgi:large subunit ribosomal protein L30
LKDEPGTRPENCYRLMATLKITQVRSKIRQHDKQKKTLEALGLRRMNQVVQHEDTPVIRGMVEKVRHLVQVDEVK